jgi:hypothetical protein
VLFIVFVLLCLFVIDTAAKSDFETWLHGMKINDTEWSKLENDKRDELREKYFKLKGVGKPAKKVDENNNEVKEKKEKKEKKRFC